MEQFMMSPLKWKTITKLGMCPGPSLKLSFNMMQLGELSCPQEIGEGKSQHSYGWAMGS